MVVFLFELTRFSSGNKSSLIVDLENYSRLVLWSSLGITTLENEKMLFYGAFTRSDENIWSLIKIMISIDKSTFMCMIKTFDKEKRVHDKEFCW